MARPEVFHIKNLVCRYPGAQRDILKIDELIIPRGKLIFVLGSSGVGKSTLLETIGLMNKTAVEGEVNFFPSEDRNAAIDFRKSWATETQTIDSIRKKYLSFIFQQTNLMENFSAYENLCLSRMIKEEVSLSDSIDSSKPLLRELGLGEHVLDLDRMPNLLSGGQRQRLAFIRALNNSAELILCDEPTGNLDEHNASVVMSLLKSACSKGKTTIVVSHDIKLALAFADEIILVTKSEAGYGEILLENIFQRSRWEGKEESVKALHKRIKDSFVDDSFNANTTGIIENENLEKTLIHHKQLFIKKEFKAISGLKRFNLIILSVILLFTLLATGFSNGSLNYLETKMNDPFINLVELIVPTYYSYPDNKKKIHEIVSTLNQKEIKSKYFLESVSPFYISHFSISTGNSPESQYRNVEFRTMNVQNDIKFMKDFILSESNLIRGDASGYKDSMDFRLVVTEDFLKKLNYDISADYILFRYPYSVYDSLLNKSFTKYFTVPVGVMAVTKALPGKYGALMPDKLYFALANEETKSENKFSEISPYNNFRHLSFISYDTTVEFRKQISDYLNKELPPFSLMKEESYKFGSVPLDKYRINFDEPVNSSLGTFQYWEKLMKSDLFSDKKILNIVEINSNDFISYAYKQFEVQRMATYFLKLDYVKDFDNELKSISADYAYNDNENTEISTDISKIEEKESYLFLSTVSIISSSILLLFSVLSVSLFLGFLISNHLNKIKMNLGTFSAIGLSTQKIREIYFLIILRFISISLVVAFVTSFLLGTILNRLFISAFKSEDNMTYFSLIHPYTIIVAVIVLGAAILISQFTIKKSLSKTPGDLIYNR
jgi:ABC-type lipoprotein export system ATPase subunit